MDVKLLEYLTAFDEPFPLMLFMGVSDSRISEVIDECLRRGEPYRSPDDDDRVY